jgi:chitinase
MGNALLHFFFTNSYNTRMNPVSGACRVRGESTSRPLLTAFRTQLRKATQWAPGRASAPVIMITLLAGLLMMSLPMHAMASQVTLTWDVKNQTQDGFRVFKRTESQAFDYSKPAWPTDGLDHTQTSCTLTDLAEGVRYYFVVRAYAGNNQSDDSNEVTYMAPAQAPETVVKDDHAPAAEAGANQSVTSGDRVTLDGSGSFDLDGDSLTYTWIQTNGPTVELSGANSVQCSFTAPDPGADSSVMIFELNVSDGLGKFSSDTCIVMINATQQLPDDAGSTVDNAQDTNDPPGQPALMGIADGESGVSLTPLMKASVFADSNPDDQHLRTEWRIVLSNDRQQIVLDRTYDQGDLVEMRVPRLVLDPSTAYAAQVRFFDDNGLPSPWSQPVTFTTCADENDLNENRIPDSQEIVAPMDMNGDTIADTEQALVVKSLSTYNELHMMSVSTEMNDSTVQLQAAASVDPATLNTADNTAPYSESETPYGFLGYKVKVDQPGDVVAVKFNLSDPLDTRKAHWVRYDVVDGISNCDASTDIDEDGLVVNRYLVDGGDEDADGVANGVIVELSGPLETDAANNTSETNLTTSDNGPAAPGRSSSGCFIRSLF